MDDAPWVGSALGQREDLVQEAFLKVHRRLADQDRARHPVPDIAKLLDIPLDTAYSRLRLARAQLAAAATRLRIARGTR